MLIMKALAQGLVKGKIDEVLLEFLTLLNMNFLSPKFLTWPNLNVLSLKFLTWVNVWSPVAGGWQCLPYLGPAEGAGCNSGNHFYFLLHSFTGMLIFIIGLLILIIYFSLGPCLRKLVAGFPVLVQWRWILSLFANDNIIFVDCQLNLDLLMKSLLPSNQSFFFVPHELYILLLSGAHWKQGWGDPDILRLERRWPINLSVFDADWWHNLLKFCEHY